MIAVLVTLFAAKKAVSTRPRSWLDTRLDRSQPDPR
jgi:hypothetical protein